MKNTNKLLYIIVIFLIGLTPVHGETDFFFSQLGARNGLSQTSVMSIFQDTDGYLWFGTRNGLNRFDGYEFKVFRNEPYNANSLSDGYICDITEDKDQNLWVATINGLNVFDSATGIITRFYPQELDTLAQTNIIIQFLHHSDGNLYAFERYQAYICADKSNVLPTDYLQAVTSRIFAVLQDREGNVYVGTDNEGVYIYNAGWELTGHLSPHVTGFGSILNRVNTLLEYNDEEIMIGTEGNGLVLYNRLKKTFRQIKRENSGLTNDAVRALMHFSNDTILIGTFGGLTLMDKLTEELVSVRMDMEEKGSLSHFSVHSFLRDCDGTLWVGTYSAGINYSSPYFKPAYFIVPDEFTGIVGKGEEDKYGNIWFATEGAGLLQYNKITEEQTLYPVYPGSSGDYERNILKSIILWGDTIFCATHFGTVYSFSIPSKEYTLLYDFGYYDIYSLYIDSEDYLWIPTNSHHQLVRANYEERRNTFPTQNGEISIPWIRVIHELEPGKFLLGSARDSIYYYDIHQQYIENLTHRIQDISKHNILGAISAIIQVDQHIWIGTTKSGIYKFGRDLKPIKHYYTKDGLSDSYISSMVLDDTNDLWVTTANNLYKLSDDRDIFIRVKPIDLPTQEFTLQGAFKTKDGTLYFPGNRGIYWMNPNRIKENPNTPPLYITGIFNDEYDDLSYLLLKKNKTGEKKYNYSITLPAQYNHLAIQYVALNYIHTEENDYMFIMEGVDREWVRAGSRRIAYYSTLAPGSYRFRVRAFNEDSIWEPQETVLSITIKPPFYRSTLAYIIYLALFLTILYKIIQYHHQKHELERDIRYKQMEKDKIKELHEERMRMFGNFSHELRTPLTLIVNSLNELIKNHSFSGEVKDILHIIKKNTNRMLLLVNNLMDIQKYEAGKSALDKQPFDLTLFVNEIYRSFESVARNRNINFRIINELGKKYDVIYDEREIEKVLFNLLSNAFKFTPGGGQIEWILQNVSAEELKTHPGIPPEIIENALDDRYIYMEINDSGRGFHMQDAGKIFEPFYQSGDDLHKEVAGTGIGLSLTKSIIHQHNGLIWVISEPGKGSSFRILLPDTLIQKASEEGEGSGEIKTKVNQVLEIADSSNKKTILLVEDNTDILNYLSTQLMEEYHILTAVNGKDAVECLQEKTPDMVISDVMMPYMNGIELCKHIKSTSRLSHIPVILLTAKSMTSSIQEGLMAEADDYILKPFDISLLKARVKNILSLREKMKIIYGEMFSLKNIGLDNPVEENSFLTKYIEIVKSNISDPNLDVSLIYQSLNMSRANFYRRVKAETGLSPIELITHIRLEAAAHLLKESSLNITEIAEQVGFSSRSYFAKSFKAIYGMSPTEYQKAK